MTPRVKAAILKSVTHNEIAIIDANPADLSALQLESDDSVEHTDGGQTTLVEFWGIDEDGDQWRVHARPDGNNAF